MKDITVLDTVAVAGKVAVEAVSGNGWVVDTDVARPTCESYRAATNVVESGTTI